ncbi:MAG: hypothetical protein WCC27_13025, partial [Acidobacteriaceae bacterium]
MSQFLHARELIIQTREALMIESSAFRVRNSEFGTSRTRTRVDSSKNGSRDAHIFLIGPKFFLCPYYQDTKPSDKRRQNSLRVLWWKPCGMRD